MLPKRFRIIRPYLASWIHSQFPRPPIREMAHWLLQPGKEARAMKYIAGIEAQGEFQQIAFSGYTRPFYLPKQADWSLFCQTVDECFNPRNWHHFISAETPLTPEDVVVDCGAAEGLFTFVAAPIARRVYAIEPMPLWQGGLQKTFADTNHVQILNVAVSHKEAQMKMTDADIFSRISNEGAVDIQVTTLDHLFPTEPISFIKADVEGFEFPMLLGAEEVIRRNRPKISVTVYHDANHFVELMDFLRSIHPDYRFRTRGLMPNGHPILLQAY